MGHELGQMINPAASPAVHCMLWILNSVSTRLTIGTESTHLVCKFLIDRIAAQFYARSAESLEKNIILFLREKIMTVIRYDQRPAVMLDPRRKGI